MILQGSSSPSIVFVSIPGSCPAAWVPDFVKKGAQSGVDVRAYCGLPSLPVGQTSKAHEEARADMFAAKRVFVAAIPLPDGTIDGDWVISQTIALAGFRVEVDIGLLDLTIEMFADKYNVDILASTTRIEHYSDASSWHAYVLECLTQLSC